MAKQLQDGLIPVAASSAVDDAWRRRHPEWAANLNRWTWLLDSYEGGLEYRGAVYGTDTRGLPIHNLIRHKREYPDPAENQSSLYNPSPVGLDPAYASTDDDFQLRRARTPAPTFVSEAIDGHLDEIYEREISRKGPSELEEFWLDVDGNGTTIDQWMAESVAPLLMLFGQIDILIDRPSDHGYRPITEYDRVTRDLDHAVASVVLPTNVVWWRLDPMGAYEEVLVQEFAEDDNGIKRPMFRHWTKVGWTLYGDAGRVIASDEHEYGVVPITRIFDRRKARCRNIGKTRYESVAERQREYYNRDSELILSDTTQAHPLLQGPEDFFQADGTIPIGPNWLLQKKKSQSGSSIHYEGFDVIEFPKVGAESLRRNKADIRDEVDREAKLNKPSGMTGVAKGQIEQSGISKHLDHKSAHALLSKIASCLQRAERTIAFLAMTVIEGESWMDEDNEIEVVYPTSFDLFSASDVTVATGDFMTLLSRSGNLPDAEIPLLQRLYRLVYPGQSDAFYSDQDRAIDGFVRAGGGLKLEMERKAKIEPINDPGGNVKTDVTNPRNRLLAPGQTSPKENQVSD